MGYTHYWYRPPKISDSVFHAISSDFQRLIVPMADMGIQLAGWDGKNEPEINDERIRFNGHYECGHPDNEEVRCIPYPAEDAQGLGPSATQSLGPGVVWVLS